MVARTTGAVLLGVEARLVDVEVDLAGGLPVISAVGLPDAAVREGVDRVRSALRHSGFELPQRRVVINLAPAEVPKRGAGLDLPIAAALLQADAQIRPIDPARTLIVGELGLDGSLRPVRGTLSRALAARAAGRRRLVVPRATAAEARLVAGVEVYPLDHLREIKEHAAGTTKPLPPTDPARLLREAPGTPAPDMADVRGQASARRALEVAAAGGHHLLMTGPPGSGKTMLARRMPGILPRMGVGEALGVTRIWSAAGLVSGLVTRRPFRAPHHGVSAPGLVGGGGSVPRPGEISLASEGVLYLDELPEFRRDALEALRQPLEEGIVRVTRVAGSFEFPARFALVAAMNPCPCGWHGSPGARCGCSPRMIQRYLGKISGPLLDRFDLVVRVPPLALEVLNRPRTDGDEASEPVARRVERARERQRERFGGEGPASNAAMGPKELDRFAGLPADGRRLLLAARDRLGLTARGFDRVRRVARTLADLEGTEGIEAGHVAEALQYRKGELVPAAGE